ncbi:MAG: hypothetical protein RQ842_05745, partial [Vulcanisaeta sp.]|nr:hypothetical protein [Vulcanisaeta sp.]
EVVDAIEATTTPERRAVQNMIEIAKRLGYPGDALGVITSLVNNPSAFDARLVRRQVDLTEWERLVRWLGRDPQKFPLNPDDRKNADKIDLLLDLLYSLANQGITRVLLFANSPEGVVRGRPRALFGVDVSIYNDNNAKRRGYSVGLAELVKQLLALVPEGAEEQQGQGQSTGAS